MKKLLVIGHSHVTALMRAAADGDCVPGRNDVTVHYLQMRGLRLHPGGGSGHAERSPEEVDAAASALRLNASIAAVGADATILYLHGNAHSAYGIVHGRSLPRQAKLDDLERRTQGRLRGLFAALLPRVPRPLALLLPPPPNESEGMVRAALAGRKGIDADELEIEPSEVRLQLWAAECAALRGVCAEHGVAVIELPADVGNPRGFLAGQFAHGRDPTHANSAYGERILRHSLDIVELVTQRSAATLPTDGPATRGADPVAAASTSTRRSRAPLGTARSLSEAYRKPGCILHFGMHKTGSSSIQESLARHLDDARFRFASLGDRTGNASAAVQIAFMHVPHRIEKFCREMALGPEQRAARATRVIELFHRELEHCARQTVILSAEALWHLTADELRVLVDLVRGHTDQITAVGYVRDAHGYMQSAFQQRIRAGGENSQFRADVLYPNYRNRFTRFIEVLGSANVQFWPFDPATFPNGCVVQDFCTRLGIDFPADRVLRRNESLSLPAVQLLFAYRRFGPRVDSIRTAPQFRRLLEALKVCEGPKFFLDASFTMPVIERRRADASWMEQQLGSALPGAAVTRGTGAGVRAEADLLTFCPEARKWLGARSEAAAVARDDDWTPEFVVARLTEVFDRQPAAELDARARDRGVRNAHAPKRGARHARPGTAAQE